MWVEEVFLRVPRFSPLLKNQHFQIPIRQLGALTFNTGGLTSLTNPRVDKVIIIQVVIVAY